MKDSEFIELLNLYVDHEISAADAARLEAEVQANPVRRQTYQQYCRMQKACKLLAADFQTTPETRKVVAFEAPRRASHVGQFAAFGALAAAACVAFVFVSRNNRPVPAAAPTYAAAETARTIEVAPAVTPERNGGIVHMVSMPAPQSATVGGNSLLLSNQADGLRASTSENVDPRFQWMTTVQFAPIQRIPMENFRFEKPVMSSDAIRLYSGPRPMDPQVESAAFKFNK